MGWEFESLSNTLPRSSVADRINDLRSSGANLMLRIPGTRRTLCGGATRRDFLNVGALSTLGIHLTDLFAAPARADHAAGFGTAKSCILVFPYGSPSSHETFDPKPQLPEIQGELKDIGSSVEGLRICEGLPRVAQVMDRATVVRTMTHPYPVHGLAYAVSGLPTYTPELETRARDPRQWPFIGSIVDYLDRQHATGAQVIPRNIGLPWLVNSKTDLPAVNAGPWAAFLGAEYDPLWTDFDGAGLHVAPKNTVSQTKRFKNPFGGTSPDARLRLSRHAELIDGVSIERLGLRRLLLEQFDKHARLADRNARLQAMNSQQQLAMSLLTSNRLRDALDIGQEKMSVRERYGITLFGQACLAARRLIEAGGRFVTVFWDCFGQFANGAWDTHQYHYPRMKQLLLPSFDLAYSALLDDLDQRGLLDETLVICMSEHGRTPRITNKPGGGRDHWSRAYSAVLAGGGTARGKVVGQTTRDGGDVLSNPVSPKDILATAFHLLGIDPHTTVNDQQGRPHAIAGSGQLRPELLG